MVEIQRLVPINLVQPRLAQTAGLVPIGDNGTGDTDCRPPTMAVNPKHENSGLRTVAFSAPGAVLKQLQQEFSRPYLHGL